ncbi:hypothetical protein [Nocardia sp. CS682]|uniref:hypothetical protein n=1 Tax=Nocardia sp. CS682 TaxID=1047172 RepID=UPI001074E1AF|nr:hypothetical protein [Nocardia sp. CS682]QBS43556.1 hypothetical protein DMB37_29085 [Nocardia sp. CS682]
MVAVEGAKALIWTDEGLYDVAAGWRSIPLDGSSSSSRFSGYGAEFDATTVSPLGDVVALVASTGDTGLLLRPDGELIREINRSDYCADAYRYPLALYTLPDGRTGLVHCPDDYNRLEVEVAVSGERITVDTDREPEDVFHSRLGVSPNGRYLLSAGWVWHPVDWLAVYKLSRASTEPAVLDSLCGFAPTSADVAGACFLDNGDLVISTCPGAAVPEDPESLGPDMLARWSPATKTFVWRKQLDLTAGDVVAMAGHILALHEYPRLYDATSGALVAEWPDLLTGPATSSIVWDESFSGTARVAIDPAGQRFAVTDSERITIVRLE